MKIFIIFPSLLRGGAEEYALIIGSAAVAHGMEVHAAFPDLPETSSLKRDFLSVGINFHPLRDVHEPLLSTALLTKGPGYLIRVLSLFWKVRPDAFHIVLPFPDRCFAPILAAALIKTPAVVVFQLVPPDFVPMSGLRRHVYRWAKKRGQEWIAISENNRQILSNQFSLNSNEIVKIYNGCKIPELPSEDAQQVLCNEFRRELNLQKNSRILLTVGRLHPQKGYDMLLSIIPEVIREYPDTVFVWVGEGELRSDLEKIIYENSLAPFVKILGYRSDVGRIMRASDLFVFPTRYEGGQSFALSEAMAHSMSIVTTRASGITEFIQHGHHGLLTDVDDSNGLLENILWALQNPTAMEDMGHNARCYVQMYSEERMAAETLDLLSSLI